ncbi:hypothetical protein E5678_19745 [Hydrogenophaga sp. PAMC20947]|nr:hypothetical protein E5678_19745 [Hydrogenophaga sp. PAMC20947]
MAQRQTCGPFMQRLDALVDQQGVRDGGAARLAGFAHARVDRLLASFALEAQRSDERWLAWASAAAALDREARTWELMNLTEAVLPDLKEGDRPAIARRADNCSEQAWTTLGQDPSRRRMLLEQARVPDDYAMWKRALGLYPLTRWPFYAGVERWQAGWARELRQGQTQAAGGEGGQRWSAASAAMAPAGVSALMEAVSADALGIPRPTEAQSLSLLQAYAPEIEVAQRGPFDLLGRLHWGDAVAPQVDAAHPTVYARVAHTRYGQTTLLQLVYSAWFSERPAEGPFDLLSGAVDGVVMRLTLAPDGRPLLADSIHACGCYHLFVPAQALVPRPAPGLGEEWAFAPIRLPALAPGERLLWRLASGSHMVESVTAAPQGIEVSAGGYQLVEEDQLRSLSVPEGGRRSAFAPDGIMPGTQRGERVFFWPMGIASPGAMRQWGRQPTAFVGRRHFDEPRLIEERFEIEAGVLP